jgi:AraC family transcriptional activator of pobA
MMHRFQYVRGSRYTTIRFQTGIQETAWRSADLLRAPKTKALYKALCAMFDKKGKDPLPDTEFVLDALVSTLFELCYALNPKEKQASVLADGLRAYLRERGGEYATVESVASRWGLSAGRFSARFRSETGCSLKSFLDRERGEIAKQLVIFSDLSLKQIAFRMGFNDLFCFSRFFKRIYGVSPRSVRMRGLSLTDMRVIAKNPKTSA